MDEHQQKKIFLMRVGVSTAAVFVLILWILNLQGAWRVESERSVEIGDGLQELRLEIDQAVGDLNNRLDGLETGIIDDAEDGESVLSDNGKFLVDDLIKKAENMAVSPAEDLSDGEDFYEEDSYLETRDENKQFCPEYINCMPTIGEARPCVIPVGCEEITQIAY